MDDEEICRVCRSESTPDHQLYHPCKCSGSIRFVHEDCLIEWLSHSKKKYCELCEYPFTFSPIYRDDMPEKVPLFVLFSQLLRRLASLIKTVVRGLTVVIVWLIILPNFTLWTWRFYFWSGETIIGFNNSGNQNATTAITTTAETLTPVTTQPTSYLTFETLKSFLSDCVEGQIITAFVVIIFVAAYLFREWVLQNLPAEQAPLNDENPIIENANQNNNNNEQLVQEQVAIDTLLNAMQVINPINQNNEQVDNYMDRIGHRLEDIRNELQNELARNNNNNEPETFEWSSYIQDRNLDESNDQLFGGLDGMGSSSSQHNQQHLDNANDDDNEYVGWPASESSRRRMDDDDDYEEDEDEEEEEEEEEGEDRLPELVDPARMNNVAIQRILDQHLNPNLREIRQIPIVQPPQPAAAAEEEEPFDVGDDINGVLEAIGMRGNPWMLVQNSVLMSLMISLCLGIAVWVPYVIGRLVILIRPISFIETPIYVMRLVTDPLVDFVLDLCVPYTWSLVLSIVPQNIQLAMESLQEQFSQIVEGILSSAVSMSNETIVVVEEPTNTAATTTLGMVDNMLNNIDWELVQSKVESVGTAALARWHQFATGRTGLDRSMCIVVGYLVLIAVGSWYLTHSRRRANSGRPSSATGDTIQDIIRQQGIFLKVLFFILIELVVFPTVCGFLLDMATLPLFVNASFSSRYAFHLKSPYSSHFLHWFLGTGVLFYFAIFITVCREIIRPGVMWFIRDPNDPQFHPVQEMVEKPLPTLLQKISQSALIYSGMLVFGVGTVTYSLAYTGVVFPLRLPFNAPLSTLAIDLLIIQFLLPPLIAFIKPRDYSKKALDLWWHFACRQLRLTSFMFNVRKPDEEGRHIRRTLKAMLLFQKAEVPTDTFSDVDIEDDHSPVVFKRDGMMIRVPKYDSVPVDPTRRMLVPVDPVTLEPIDDEERRRGHPATADTNDEAQSTIVVYIPPNFKRRCWLVEHFLKPILHLDLK
ncbi:hypothetical protein HPULCUR_004804 [Helicostylum pulchrum]|uniref:RING-type E3 ubiquitin transferase n=1 Tax=Helicostylum pulchrum TaxID=562976 RepID=A0ABP9XXA1_9FUNG